MPVGPYGTGTYGAAVYAGDIAAPYRPPDDRLMIVVEHADGRTTRWGYDETDGARIPADLTFTTSIPGGFGSMQCNLLRRINQDYPDLGLFDIITVYGPGGRVVWQGRMQQFPRSHGDSFAITPGAVGLSSHLRDDPTFREIYVDSSFQGFHEPPVSRRQALATASHFQGKIQVVIGNGIAWQLPNESLPDEEISEVHYDAGVGLTIARLAYRGRRQGTFTGFEAATAITADTEDFSGSTTTLGLTLDDTLRSDPFSTAHRYLLLRAYVSSGAVTPPAGTVQSYSKIAVVGNHGLTLRTTSTGEPDGVTASDVITNVIGRAAPLLSTAGVESTSFGIPHAVYRDPTTAEFVISDVNKYHLWDWGVYDDREFFYRQPDPDRLCWEARLGDGAHMDADGLTGEQVYNGVTVTFTDPLGVTRTVGPPSGTAGSFDATDASLADTSSSNPVNAWGIPAKPLPLTLSFPSRQDGAIQIGAVALAEGSLNPYRGTLTLTGTVRHPTEGLVPVWRVRAGDWIRVTDLNGENASVQRKIIETSYSHSSRTVTLSLDRTPAKLGAILARVGIQAGIATGGGF